MTSAKRSFRCWLTVAVMGTFLIFLTAFGTAVLVTYDYDTDPTRVLPVAAMTLTFAAIAAWVWIRGGTITATPEQVSWRVYLQRYQKPASEVLEVGVITGTSGSWTRSWPVIRTGTAEIELRKLQVPLKRTDDLQRAIAEMNVVLGAHASQPHPNTKPPLRLSRPISLFPVAALAAAMWLAFAFTQIGQAIPAPLAVIAAAGGALLIGTWLPGGAVIVGDTSIQQTGQGNLTIALADVASFRIERRRRGLTTARLVAQTSNGEVPFDAMTATWGQVARLQEVADRLNKRLERS